MPRIFNSLLFKLVYTIESFSKKEPELKADNVDSAFKVRYYNNAKAKNELGWSPQISFEQSINDTIKWMDDNGFFRK